MILFLQNWYRRYLASPEAGVLLLLIVGFVCVVSTLAAMLMPLFASLIIAFLLEALVLRIDTFCHRRWLSVLIAYSLFIGILVVLIVFLIPLLWAQMANLVSQLPTIVGRSQLILTHLEQSYPQIFTDAQINTAITQFRGNIAHYGQVVLTLSLSSIPTLISLVIYLILVPLLIYFFLMDKDKLLAWISNYLPHRHGALEKISAEVHVQLGNYVKGKVIEIIIVTFASYLMFSIIQLQYAFLLAVAVGVSVLIPYIGALVVTVPVLIIGFVQWGWSSHFLWLIAIYSIIIALDGNVLVPFLFSEAVSLHPVAIIVAVVFFGGIWGFWGIFFAIPLASLVKAILGSWPVSKPIANTAKNMVK
ncbi:MAG: AI-2E family transporter [Gammaproteobacteria bacterium]|nr:AI-2E family transporter [Gammaproteobacteria bacterium]